MSAVEHDGAPAPFSRKSRYILVVEGVTNELFITAMLLQRFNYPVCTARNARQALDMVSVAMPALVVSDHVLPGLSGIDLLRVLGSNAHTFSIPVILLMPPGDAGLANRDIEVGGTFVLQKPVQIEELYRSVQAAMEATPRTNLRVQTVLPVAVNRKPLDSSRGECATHLSAQGMYIRTFKYHRPDEKVSVSLTLEGHTVNADAVVLYTRRQDDSPSATPGMAVKFTKITGEDREHIRQFIHNEVMKGIVLEGR